MTLAKSLLAIVLSVLFVAGCSKQVAQEGPPKAVDLGTVEMTYSQPSRHDLGDGKACVLRAETMGPGTIELAVTVEKAGKELASTRAVPVNIGKPLELTLGGFNIKLIPQVH